MTKSNDCYALFCTIDSHPLNKGVQASKGKRYFIRQHENNGGFIVDDKGDKHYLSDFNWELDFLKEKI